MNDDEKPRVLIVEHDEAIRQTLALALESLGCVPIMPANQWLHIITRAWLTLAALGRPVVPEV